jgi:hypothetical protein
MGVGIAAAPALTYAQHTGGGGGGGGGGGHTSGGGGHTSGGGAHTSGGGGGHFGGGAPHMSAGGGYHGAAYGGTHYARGGYTYAPGHVGYGGTYSHGGGGGYYHGGGGGYYPGGGYYHGGYYGGGHYWGGGYWHGGYWPYVWYRPGWSWFYPVLPIGYATFWWGGIPYYYWNNLYYTWNPGYNGYVVSDPPMATDTYDDSAPADASGVTAAPPASYQPSAAGGSGAGSDVYVYPRNGQSEQQTSTDRYECHSWAANQTGFDPTRGAQSGTGTPADYRRAMIACLDARGYSAR